MNDQQDDMYLGDGPMMRQSQFVLLGLTNGNGKERNWKESVGWIGILREYGNGNVQLSIIQPLFIHFLLRPRISLRGDRTATNVS